MAAVLLICDQPALIDNVQQMVNALGSVFLHVTNAPEQARAVLAGENVQLTMVHARAQTDEKKITSFIESVAQLRQSSPIVVLAESYCDTQAISFFRAGVADYLSASQDLPKVSFLLDVLTLRNRPATCTLAGPADRQRDPFYYVVTPEASGMMEHARRVAAQNTTLLLTGETGTGKTRLARLIHDLSPRCGFPFLVADCAAPSPNLIDGALFGQAAGACAGSQIGRKGALAAASEGTILLDEINALPPPMQGKLLRVLDEGLFEPLGADEPLPWRARVIAASPVPLDQEVLAGKFHADLFYRLNVVGFFLPPLREQRSAIVPLCEKFLAEFSERTGRAAVSIDPQAQQALRSYPWPGNIRELRNVIERALALTDIPSITLNDIPERIALCDRNELSLGAAPRPILPASGGVCRTSGTLHQVREEVEVQQIRAALRKHRNNRLRAAVELGISRMGLYKKLHKYGLLDVNPTGATGVDVSGLDGRNLS